MLNRRYRDLVVTMVLHLEKTRDSPKESSDQASNIQIKTKENKVPNGQRGFLWSLFRHFVPSFSLGSRYQFDNVWITRRGYWKAKNRFTRKEKNLVYMSVEQGPFDKSSILKEFSSPV